MKISNKTTSVTFSPKVVEGKTKAEAIRKAVGPKATYGVWGTKGVRFTSYSNDTHVMAYNAEKHNPKKRHGKEGFWRVFVYAMPVNVLTEIGASVSQNDRNFTVKVG